MTFYTYMRGHKMDTTSFSVRILCCLLLALLPLPLTAGRPRHGRSHAPVLRVSTRIRGAHPTGMLFPGGAVSVACRAKGGQKVADIPYISFYLDMGDSTTLPLSNAYPGITITSGEPSKKHHNSAYNRNFKQLTVGPQMYELLAFGENKFVCRAGLRDGSRRKSVFIITKTF